MSKKNSDILDIQKPVQGLDILDSVAETARQFEPSRSFAKLTDKNSQGMLLEKINKNHDLIDAISTPLKELSCVSLGLNSSKGVMEAFESMRQSFILPELQALSDISKSLVFPKIPSIFQDGLSQHKAIVEAMEAMRTPWLNTADLARSVAGFSELQNIGAMLHDLRPFDDGTADALRRDLGDWRAKITWSKEIFEDPGTRSDFYVDRGFNKSLTDFPAEAFQESLSIAGLREAPAEVSRNSVLNEPSRSRNREAFDRLQVFEAMLRHFISEQMSLAFGASWMKQQLPSVMFEQWKEKKKRAIFAGEPERALIEYADFTDYLEIITRNDNWRKVFVLIFKRKSLIQESLQRLYPIRICTMHARAITQDDELFLCAESRRILVAIGFKDPNI